MELHHHVSKLTLLEVYPLYPFLFHRRKLNCIEVGGNIGLWCEAFHHVFSDKVSFYDAYEPLPGNIKLFERRLSNWMPEASHVRIHQQCVGDSAGTVMLRFHKEISPLASVVVRQVDDNVVNNKSMEVPQVLLDDVIDQPIDLIKIDVEGYEWNVLQGAVKSIEAGRIDCIYFEFGKHQKAVGQTFRQFYDFLTSRGFTVYRQEVERNYFGLEKIHYYSWKLEDKSSTWMILAARNEPSEAYGGPRVVRDFN